MRGRFRAVHLFFRFIILAVFAAVSSQCQRVGPPGGGTDRYNMSLRPTSPGGSVAPSGGATSGTRILREVNLKQDMVPRRTHGRKVVRPMEPRYITIHSTQNYSADAWKHSLALKNGALRSPKTRTGNRIGYLIWHFTVDDRVAIQHMPTNEQGEHADFHGPGATIERTAKLTAILMKRNGIPLANVKPHYHWPRAGRSPAHKNCPHFLLDHGKPGQKWRWFQGRVNYYYKSLAS